MTCPIKSDSSRFYSEPFRISWKQRIRSRFSKQYIKGCLPTQYPRVKSDESALKWRKWWIASLSRFWNRIHAFTFALIISFTFEKQVVAEGRKWGFNANPNWAMKNSEWRIQKSESSWSYWMWEQVGLIGLFIACFFRSWWFLPVPEAGPCRHWFSLIRERCSSFEPRLRLIQLCFVARLEFGKERYPGNEKRKLQASRKYVNYTQINGNVRIITWKGRISWYRFPPEKWCRCHVLHVPEWECTLREGEWPNPFSLLFPCQRDWYDSCCSTIALLKKMFPGWSGGLWGALL